MICSSYTLQQELSKICSICINNGFPVNIDCTMEWKIDNFNISPKFGPSLSPMFLKLPWLGRKCKILSDRFSRTVSATFFSAKLRVGFGTHPVFPSFTKDRLSYLSKSLLIYKFKCQCEAEYIGQTSLRLETRMDQHVPKYIRLHSNNRVSQSGHNSAIGQHLLENEMWLSFLTMDSFSILHIDWSKHHLLVIDAIYLKLQ